MSENRFADVARAREQQHKEIIDAINEIANEQKALKMSLGEVKRIVRSNQNSTEEGTAKTIETLDTLNAHIAELDKKIEKSTNAILVNIQNKSQSSLKEKAFRCLVTAAIYVLLTCIVMKFFFGIGDIKEDVANIKSSTNAIQWNQTIGITPGARTYSPWEMNDFIKAWNNQNAYVEKYRQENVMQE